MYSSPLSVMLLEYMERWDPTGRRHCSTCQRATVGGVWPNVVARCQAGHGSEMMLIRLLRPANPSWFRGASGCEDYETGEEERHGA